MVEHKSTKLLYFNKVKLPCQLPILQSQYVLSYQQSTFEYVSYVCVIQLFSHSFPIVCQKRQNKFQLFYDSHCFIKFTGAFGLYLYAVIWNTVLLPTNIRITFWHWHSYIRKVSDLSLLHIRSSLLYMSEITASFTYIGKTIIPC